jgi:hypothetical protein
MKSGPISPLKRFILYWAIAGFIVPVVIMIVTRLQGGVFKWPYLALTLWPSVVIAAAADVFENPPLSSLIIFVAISIGINVVVYSAIGSLVWWIFLRQAKEGTG